jgi:hypothetical protein
MGGHLTVWGAVPTAVSFYTRVGATFQTGFSYGSWTPAARDALAAGKPIEGAVLPYEKWIMLDFSIDHGEEFECRDASCRPPTSGGTGGSLQARRGTVAGYGPQGHPDVHLGGVRVTYSPDYPDGGPDPGEVVWARVRFEDDRSQSKDRPVLVIGRVEGTNRLAAIQFTSQDKGRRDTISVGAGPWDPPQSTGLAPARQPFFRSRPNSPRIFWWHARPP